MPPTFLVFVAIVIYAPLFIVVFFASVCMQLTEKYRKYSMPLLAVYFSFPVSIALACLVALPAFILSLGGIYLSEQYLAESAVYPISVALVSLAVIFFLVACYKMVNKLCLSSWSWAIKKWPCGLFQNASNK